MLRKFLISATLLATLAACQLDADEAYFPVNEAIVMMADRPDGFRQLWRIDATGVQADWENPLGLADADLSDMTTTGDQLWISSGENSMLYLVDVKGEQVSQTFELGTFQPHFICNGLDYLLLADTVEKRLGFWGKASQEMVHEVEIEAVPGQAIYESDKFYVQIGTRQVAIYREQALAQLNIVTFDHPIYDLQLDRAGRIQVITHADSQLYAAEISYNSNQLKREEAPTIYQKIQFSPYLRSSFGKEWLDDVSLEEGWVRTPPVRRRLLSGAEDFWVDFFEAKVYIQRNDSLLELDIRDKTILRAVPFSAEILRVWVLKNY